MLPDASSSSIPASHLLVPNRTQLPFIFDGGAPSFTPDQLTIRLPPMAPNTRSSARPRTTSITSMASGSEYHESNASMDGDKSLEADPDEIPEPEPVVEYSQSSRGRRIQKKSYVESASEDDPAVHGEDELDIIAQSDEPVIPANVKESPDEDDDEMSHPRYSLRGKSRQQSKLNGTVISDDEGATNVGTYRTRSRTRRPTTSTQSNGNSKQGRRSGNPPSRVRTLRSTTRKTRQNPHDPDDDGNYIEPSDASASADDEAVPSSPEADPDEDEDALGEIVDGGEPEPDQEVNQDGRPYSLRQRAKINYAIPPPLEEMTMPPKTGGGRSGRANGRSGYAGNKKKAPGWSASGAELSRWMGGAAGDDSDSDFATRTPRKGLGMNSGGMFAGSVGNTGGMFPSDLAAAAGTPSNLGKVGDASLADVDPLGVNQNVTFDEVGGLDDHINALKEMTLLPLLYPEVFQRFNVTPPRGVLFHGPPGTGKTLLARALAASCRSNGKGISFFMRKGADILSKWVGEAERQLRLLFEEARNQQPSIIFFDEIDGLAPVRSSKQDQIHASIVSTLLALMDGMDGRGQVVVIGATNRPDAIDPALRRPGRFDREFYFPLPGLEARERIIRIMTKQWSGWEDVRGEESCKGLAKLTKGYGGADLRALCTEAALNAVQRRYPQIYKSNDRLLLDPTSIDVELRDFMISVRKLIPSSARATASTASPLPSQLVPLLAQCVEHIKELINRVLPLSKKRNALEEAEWEEEGEADAMEREMMMQSMETLRVHRPRIIVHGSVGMGQEYVAAAALHHLEGYHIQNLDLGTLMGDSTRTPEATIVQLFIEAKRHQPSVVYIPSLAAWCASLSETARMTVRTMLDSLVPTDPVLLLAVVDGSFEALPQDVRAWFGHMRDNRVELSMPSAQQRDDFFHSLMEDIRRRPTQFPDGVKRKKRILEDLPIAPPLAPREPSAAELAVQEESDQRVILNLQYRLGLILTELKRKYKRFTKRAMDEYNHDFYQIPIQVDTVTTTVEVQQTASGDVMEVVNEEHAQNVIEEPAAVNGINEAPVQEQVLAQPQLFDMDLERMHIDLYKNKYLTPDDFLDDIRKIVHNAHVRVDEDPERFFRAQAMSTAARLSVSEFDAHFKHECERMAGRERKRREEFRRNKEKEKAAAGCGPAGAGQTGIRRSGRHNGQGPEISITDPVRLERNLKRQRSAEAKSPSEDERDREAKRSRLASAEADPQPVPISSPSPQRTHGVRFADDLEHRPFAPSETMDSLASEPHALNLPRRAPGLDSLLNPQSPEERPFVGHPSTSSAIAETSTPQQLTDSYMADVQLPLFTETSSSSQLTAQQMPEIPPAPDVFTEANVPQMPGLEHASTPAHEPMDVVVREPTPPPPDFILHEDQLADLRQNLRDSTHSLNIEQLEQLRATCLSCVWRHRSNWDRTSTLQELGTIVHDFVEDVRAAEYSFS